MASLLCAPTIAEQLEPLLAAIARGALTNDQRTRLQRFLRSIDVPDCDCDLIPDCKCGGQCKRGYTPEGRVRGHCDRCQGPCRCLCRCCDPKTVDCGCPPQLFQPPCRHVLAAPVHGLSDKLWILLLRAAWPRAFRVPPLDPERTVVITPLAKYARTVWRADHNYHLWRPDEKMTADEEERLSWKGFRDGSNRFINPAQQSAVCLEDEEEEP